MKVRFFTLGCKVNQYESEAMLEALEDRGFSIAGEGEPADVLVVNSCTVTAQSDQKARQALRRLKRREPGAVTEVSPHGREEGFEPMSVRGLAGHTRAFLKIEDGCERYCAYCIIPYARGRVRSKPLADLVKEVEGLAQRGYREVVLTGINLPAYGQDLGLSLCDAVEAACGVEGISRVRLGSLEPERLTPEVIERMRAQEKLCPQFHLSLQSGCDETLRRMHRHYTSGEYMKIVEDLRAAFPGCAITTDVMVGFSKAHVFCYSRRPGTVADRAPCQVEAAEMERRSRILSAAMEESRLRFMRSMEGLTEEVLIEREVCHGLWEGLTGNYTPVRVEGGEGLSGRILTVRLIKALDGCCMGEVLGGL